MKRVIFLIVVTTYVILSSCSENSILGEGDIVTESFDISDFSGVSIESSINVNITYDDIQSVLVSGFENLIEHVDLSVNDNVLKVDLKSGSYSNLNLELDIEIPTLNTLNINGSGDITVGDFTLPDLDINIDGSGNVNALRSLRIDNSLNCTINGSGDVTLVGSVPDQEIIVQGSGHFYGFGLQSDVCNVLIDGSGDVEVLVNDVLNVEIQGSGDTYYKGNPSVTIDSDGSGQVIDAN